MPDMEPKIGFKPPPEITPEQAALFLSRRLSKIALYVAGNTKSPEDTTREYLPGDSIVAMGAKKPIGIDEAMTLLADDETTMPLEIVKLPDDFIASMKKRIQPRRDGQRLRNLTAYRTLIRDENGPLLRGVPLEVREDLPGLTGTVTTADQLDNGRHGKVGFHYDDHPGVAVQLEYVVANAGENERWATFAPELNRARFGNPPKDELYQRTRDYIDEKTFARQPLQALAVCLRPGEAILRFRPVEVLHDGIPNQLGSTALMLSIDPETPYHRFGVEPWNEQYKLPEYPIQ